MHESDAGRQQSPMQGLDVADAEIQGDIDGAAALRRLLKEDREVTLIPQRDCLTLGNLEFDLQADAPRIPVAGPRPARNR